MIRQSIYIIISFVLLACGNSRNGNKSASVSDHSATQSGENLPADKSGDRESAYKILYQKYKNRHEEFLLMEILVDQYHEYSANLRKTFFRYCGDTAGISLPAISEDSISLTNQFFIQSGNSHLLYKETKSLIDILKLHCDDSRKQAICNRLDPGNEKTFTDLYFRDLPPVAAITIINSFDYKVKELEGLILSGLLNPKQ